MFFPSRRGSLAVLSLALLTAGCAQDPATPALAPPQTMTARSTAAPLGAERSAADQDEGRHQLFPGEDGALGFHNPEHGLDARIEGDGWVTLSAPATLRALGTPASEVRLRTEAWGRGGGRTALQEAPSVTSSCAPGGGRDPSGCLRQADLIRGGLREWWRNGPEGLEQGWTVLSRPDGAGPLAIDVSIEGADLRLIQGGQAALLLLSGQRLRYGALAAWDAAQRPLAVRLERSPTGLRVLVEDDAAIYPVVVDPLIVSESWTAESDQGGAGAGRSVASAGDVNGDGYDDVLVGAYQYDHGERGEGMASLYLGSAAGPAATASWTAESNQANAKMGISVASAGDVNGDGFDDVIVGTDWYDNGEENEGRADVYLGSAAGLSSAAAWGTEGDQDYAVLGYSVASAGDVNGDGYDDVIVGAFGFDNAHNDGGRVFVYLGSASGLESTASWSDGSDQSYAYFGWSVASAGDVNGDGFDDVLVGTRWLANGQTREGGASLYLGSATGLGLVAAWTAEADQAYAELGYSVASAGDVNGDGYDDVLVGAIGYDDGETDEGAAFLYLGSSTGLDAVPAWSAGGDQAGAGFGASVASAGDVNGDGYDDVIIGAPSYDHGETDEGQGFLYLGSPTGLQSAPDWAMESNQGSAALGTSVASAGDVDGDGYDDLLLGAPSFSNGQTFEGRVFLYPGSASLVLVNDPPVATADSVTVEEGGDVVIPVLANDSDVDNTLRYADITLHDSPAHGVALLGTSGVTYSHDGSESNVDSFTYDVTDGALTSEIVTVSITITPVNDIPVATPDSATVAEGGDVAIDVISNDSDVEGPLSNTGIAIVSPAAHGLTIVGGPGVTYIHDGGESTEDSFTYEVSDGQDASNPVLVSITILPVNDPPMADAGGPYAGDQGADIPLDASASTDPEGPPSDFAWDCTDDGTFDVSGPSAAGLTCAYPQVGGYTARLRVTDSEGATAEATALVTIDNVPPVITSTPSALAWQDALWSYAATADDPGGALTWALAPAAPDGMTVAAATGLVTWTPTYDQALLGSAAGTLTVQDADGGAAQQTFALVVAPTDGDADGLPDSWELANGLDPGDPADAAQDGDGDGLDNAAEWQRGSDPTVFDGPTTPALLGPVDGETMDSSTPELRVTNATDPQDDPLTYEFEVYAEEALTTPLASGDPTAEDPSGSTAWTVDTSLPENVISWWRARASDPWGSSAWSAPESFFVNEVEEAPSTPSLVYPVGGEWAPRQPTLLWALSVDPDGDEVTYDVEILDAGGAVVDSASALPGGAADGSWPVDGTLDEDGSYSWRARAVGGQTLASDWSDPEPFRTGDENGPPVGVRFLSPEGGEELDAPSPDLVASAGTDPEGGALTYAFALDTVPTFDGPELQTAERGGEGDTVTWSLADDGIELPPGQTIYAQVQARDVEGVGSVPDTVAFSIRADDPVVDDDDSAQGSSSAGTDCACDAGGGGGIPLLLLLPMGLRRRRARARDGRGTEGLGGPRG